MREIWKTLVRTLVSLQLTVVLLILSLVLVFVATLAQVNLGIWAVQEKYFRSFFIYWQVPGSGFAFPIFPGGYLIGGLLFFNLIAGHVYRFKLNWKKAGIFLTHFGLMFLLVGELLSGLWQEDFQMRLDEGQTSNFSESQNPGHNELAIVDTTDPKWDEVVAIPEKLLARGNPIQHPKLPFRVAIRAYYPNAEVQMRSQVTNPPPPLATSGMGAEIAVTPRPVTDKPNEIDTPAASVELIGTNGSLGTWLVSTLLANPQTFTSDGKTWKLVLRPERYYKPFSLTLLKITNDFYPGSDIPKNFVSRVRLKTQDGATDREVSIYMNNPLRFAGLTFYQYQMNAATRNSVLQVVRNPSWRLPYVACLLMSLGLLIQFGISLYGFLRKRSATAKLI